MPRFGADGVLKPAEIQAVADYVMILYGETGQVRSTAAADAGKKLYAENCVPCHGEAGAGNREVGGTNWPPGCICTPGTEPRW